MACPRTTGVTLTKTRDSCKISIIIARGFPGGTVVKNPPANAGTRVRALVREDPTCLRATKPVCYNH